MIENKGDLISREYMKKAIAQYFVMEKYYHPHSKGRKTIPTEEVIDIIDNAPTVTPDKIQAIMSDYLIYRCEPERPHGKWKYNQYDGNPNIGNWHCSNCLNICYEMKLAHNNCNFCPNCGADMRGKEE